MDTMQSTPTKRTRRYHPPDLKRQVVAASQQPGASVAGVALAHGLNANLVRRWMKEATPDDVPPAAIPISWREVQGFAG